MEYPDVHYPEDTLSFPTQQDVLNYLHSYANQFELKKYIRFNHLVIRVSPIPDDRWEIVVQNVRDNTYETKFFDAVFICNGHYSAPQIPKIPGANEFKGIMFHSHDFRSAEAFRGMLNPHRLNDQYSINIFCMIILNDKFTFNFSFLDGKKDERVLVIGAGPSGVDIVAHLSKTASQVTFSQRKIPNETKEERDKRVSLLPRNTTLQDDVKRFTAAGAEFIDGSHQTFDVVIYATGTDRLLLLVLDTTLIIVLFCIFAVGYVHSYRFLSADCGIHIDNNFVQPLYKQVLNINYPTMAFICIVIAACYNSVSDLQVSIIC